jgi:hypothetical protein
MPTRLQEAKLADVPRLVDEGWRIVMDRWAMQPAIVGRSHFGLLCMTQQFVEISESAHMLVCLG